MVDSFEEAEFQEEAGLRGFILSQLRVKITFPYLILAILLAVAGTYFVTRTFARTLEDRFTARLIDSGRQVTDGLVQIEQEQLTVLRAMVHTEGMGEAVRDGNVELVARLIKPLAINERVDSVDVLDLASNGLFAMHHNPASDEVDDYQYELAPSYAEWPLVSKVIEGQVDEFGDKYADLVATPWGYVFYTSGPVKVEEELVGVLLVGTYLDSIVRRMDSESLARVTVYGTDGQVLATTLTARDSDLARISAEQYNLILALQKDRILIRPTVTQLGSREYVEAFGMLEARDGHDIAVFSVASPRELVTAAGEPTRNQMIALFGAAILAIVGIGVLIARMIVRPVFALVKATQRVAEGHLDTEVRVQSRDEIGILARAFNRMIAGLREREFIKDIFGRVVTKEVRETLMETFSSGEIKLGGETRVVTMLFTDIRDFTAMSEQYEPSEVVSFLNEYFTAMVDVVSDYGGVVNKFGGDSTLVIFGAPVEQPDHARQAVMAALAMRCKLKEFNAERVSKGQHPIRIGMGINTGQVVAGQIGSKERLEYTVIGDAVNVTSRIEDLTKEYPGHDILISETTYQDLGKGDGVICQDLGEVMVKGKKSSVRIYSVMGREGETDER
ncbi:MAG: adenylate/guanylate cyclase domain-containing protein [Anaerolineae bacterium]